MSPATDTVQAALGRVLAEHLPDDAEMTARDTAADLVGDELTAEGVAQSLWRMGASLDHDGCTADDGSWDVNACSPCDRYLLALGAIVVLEVESVTDVEGEK